MDTALPPLIRALLDPVRYDHAVEQIQLVETHISWVILTGPYAYKIKKPLDLGFLDFSTLEKRRHYCEEELRLNRRQAAVLYLGVIPLTGTPLAPVLGGAGEPIEYAVKMLQFPQESRLDRLLARGALGAEQIDSLVRALANFHERIAIAGYDQPFGTPDRVYAPVRENFEQILPRVDAAERSQLRRLETWSALTFEELRHVFEERKYRGFVRECHGDAHLANMIWYNGRVLLFDCLEFNDDLRWIDLMSELAFLVMDLDDRGRPDLARRTLNGYLEHSGDYRGLALLRFYQVYRALVRAKVACIRAEQGGLSEEDKRKLREEYRGYANLAERYTQALQPVLLITHGLSGSGKTWLTQQLLQAFDIIRLRSDVERKRLHGLAPGARSGSGIAAGLYSAEAGRRTYARLAELAYEVLRAGYPVLVDAAFLKREQRERLRAVAVRARVPFAILDLHAEEQVLRERLQRRAREATDASEADLAVLAHQLATREPLTGEEQDQALAIDTAGGGDVGALLGRLRERLGIPIAA
jgi:aminoglycoside phosphotransferase family enzyme/predicted kinase